MYRYQDRGNIEYSIYRAYLTVYMIVKSPNFSL